VALTHLALEQATMLDSAGSVVRPGGWLVYATCSLEPEENEEQVAAFLERHPAFRRDPPEGFPAELLSARGDLVLLPQRHGVDGAFAARLLRVPA
jgi:16S rRNA (cytosine967-C5)-methyltransferase